jgi:O-antigen ligase
MFFSIIILSFDSFFQYVYGKNIIGIPPATENRITSFFGDEAILGRYLSYLTTFLLFYIFCFKLSKKLRIFGLLIALISIASIILSGDRIPLLRILIILSLFVALIRVNKSTYLILFLITIFPLCFL